MTNSIPIPSDPVQSCGKRVLRGLRKFSQAFVLAGVLGVVPCPSATASGWLQFRGNNSDGVSVVAEHPIRWSEDENVAWKVKVPGVGWSQPIIVGDRILLTTAVAEDQPRPKTGEAGPGFSLFSAEGLSKAFGDGGTPPETVYRWQLMVFDLKTGKRIREETIHESAPTIPTHRSNSYASETPASDGERVYVYVAMVGVYCFDLDGTPIWNKPIDARPMQYGWGTGSSPILYDELLIVQCDNEEQSFLVAFDKTNGDERWSVKRDEASNWSTPWIWNNDERTELITCGGNRVRSYDPKTGEQLWEAPSHGRSATTAVGDGQRVYVGSVARSQGTSETLQAIRSGGHGDLSKADGDQTDDCDFIAWSVRRAAPQLSSPLLYEDCLYTVQQYGGIISCFDAKTGERHYRERLPGAGGCTASGWASGQHVFFLDEDGQTFVLEAGPKFNIVATNKLDGMFWSSPAIADDRVVLRGVDHLYCVSATK